MAPPDREIPASTEALPGLSPEETLAYWAWLHATALDREWKAYRAGQGGGSEFRREFVDPAWSLRMISNTTLRHIPEVPSQDEDRGRFAQLSRGLTRYGAIALSHDLRGLQAYWGSLSALDEENEAHQIGLSLAVPRYHEFLGFSVETMDAYVPVEGDQPPREVTPVPWDKRVPAGELGHPPTVRLWCWLTSLSSRLEARVCGKDKDQMATEERKAMLWRMRALRLTLADIWRLLPTGGWRDQEFATWAGLCLGLTPDRAAVLEQRSRQRAVDRAEAGSALDRQLACLYSQIAARVRAAFGFDEVEQPRSMPTRAPGRPDDLGWTRWLCRPGLMIWDTTVELTREGFIERAERG